VVGSVKYSLEDQILGETDVIAVNQVKKIGFGHVLLRIFSLFMI